MSAGPDRPRGPGSPDWKSFWDLATPLRAAAVLSELYGDGAVEAAANCSATARADSRDEDVRFWDATRAVLHRHC